MSAYLAEWAYRIHDFVSSPVRVPIRGSAQSCMAPHEFGWVCSRATDHGGRHAAGVGDGEIVAVWHEAPR